MFMGTWWEPRRRAARDQAPSVRRVKTHQGHRQEARRQGTEGEAANASRPRRSRRRSSPRLSSPPSPPACPPRSQTHSASRRRRGLALQPLLGGRRDRLRRGPRRRAAGERRLRPPQRPQPVPVQEADESLGLLPDPGLLVYIRPGALAARISGFADKETVAQAAQNAAHVDVTEAAPEGGAPSSSSGMRAATAAPSRFSAPWTTATLASSRPRSIPPAAAALSRADPARTPSPTSTRPPHS